MRWPFGLAVRGPPPTDLSDVIPKVARRSSKDKQIAGPSAPIMSLPYPFSAPGADASSADTVPFPSLPGPTGTTSSESESGSGSTGGGRGSTEDGEGGDSRTVRRAGNHPQAALHIWLIVQSSTQDVRSSSVRQEQQHLFWCSFACDSFVQRALGNITRNPVNG